MPRYFFHVVEGHSKNLVRDPEGIILSGAGEARKEAVGLARDVVRHGLHGSIQAWRVVVNDENGVEVLTVALSEIRARKIIRALFDLGGRIATFESGFGPRTFAWLLTAAVLAIVLHAAVMTRPIAEHGGRYQTASALTEGTIVAVRFVPDASMADITKFLDAYKASVVGGPRPGGFYRLGIADTTLPQAELAKTVGRMAKEKVVEIATAAQ